MIAFSIRWVDVYWYGLAYLFSFGITYLLLWYWWKNLNSSFPNLKRALTTHLDALFLWILGWVIVWWRLGHVLFYDVAYYAQNFWEIVRIDQWWMSFVGGVVGVAVWVLLYSYRHNRSNNERLLFADFGALIAPFAIFAWRLTNSLNQELRGKPVSELWTTAQSIVQYLWTTRIYSMIDTQLRVHTEMLEAVGEWVLIWVVLWITYFGVKKYSAWFLWRFAWVACILYAIIRFSIEFLKDVPNEVYGVFTVSQWMMIGLLCLWFWLTYSSTRNISKRPFV